jgi:hypothetical protein
MFKKKIARKRPDVFHCRRCYAWESKKRQASVSGASPCCGWCGSCSYQILALIRRVPHTRFLCHSSALFHKLASRCDVRTRFVLRRSCTSASQSRKHKATMFSSCAKAWVEYTRFCTLANDARGGVVIRPLIERRCGHCSSSSLSWMVGDSRPRPYSVSIGRVIDSATAHNIERLRYNPHYSIT